MDSTECGVARHLALSMPLTRDFISCLLYLSKSTTLRMYWTSLWSAPSPRPVKSNIQCIPSMTVSMSQSSARVYLPSSNLLASFLPHTQILTEAVYFVEIWNTWASARGLFCFHPLLHDSTSSSCQVQVGSSSKGAGSTAQLLLHEIHDCNPSVSFSWSTVITAILQLLLPLIYLEESQRSQAVIWHFYQKASSTHLDTFGRSCDCTIQSYWLTDIYGQLSTPGGLRFLDDSTSMRCSGRGWQDGKMARWQEKMKIHCEYVHSNFWPPLLW